jgi:hypothetical protein
MSWIIVMILRGWSGIVGDVVVGIIIRELRVGHGGRPIGSV